MGQYYKPINIDDNQWLYSHDYGNGLKLMEHSWIGNNFVGAVMALMTEGGNWFRKRIVWAGDYYGNNTDEVPYWKQVEKTHPIRPSACMDETTQKKAILINHTKKLYVRYDELLTTKKCGNEWIINPLPLLTACGNGRGGGDYYRHASSDIDKVGKWAGDVLSIEFTVPKSQWYKKFIVEFIEKTI